MLRGRRPVVAPSFILLCVRHRILSSKQFYFVRKRTLTSSVVKCSSKSVVENNDNYGGISETSSQSVTNFSENTTEQFVASLSPKQRTVLLEEIHKVQATEVKKKAEEKLASWRWRSRFGRPSSLQQQPIADPTGTYCEIPQDWLQKKVAEKSKPKSPTASELRHLALFNAVPFIGFGFLDNLIMIVAGDYIDVTIGMGLGISTMAAAALGNTISDLAGIGSAWYVENIAGKVGMRAPLLCTEQLDMMSSRWSANIGRGLGVVFGCLLGMFPLFFLSNQKEDKKDAESS